MTGPEHFRRAQEILAGVERLALANGLMSGEAHSSSMSSVAVAQVHATLAQAAATALTALEGEAAFADYDYGAWGSFIAAAPSRSAGRDAKPPDEYVPPGPLETAPAGGFRQPGEREAAFAAVLDGVPLGAHDRNVLGWLVHLDDQTCRTIASVMWRCRVAGAPDA